MEIYQARVVEYEPIIVKLGTAVEARELYEQLESLSRIHGIKFTGVVGTIHKFLKDTKHTFELQVRRGIDIAVS